MATVYLGDTYEVIREIGSGGLGTVFLAYHKNLQKKVVVKRIDVEGKSVEENRREADILKNLHHSYLPQVFDLIVMDGVWYTVMDYIEGQSFKELLDQGRVFSQKEAAKYGTQLLEALVYLHGQKVPVLHGDIKPANVMLTPDDNICLIDFNISGVMVGRGMMTVGFSKGYASPEQVKAIREVGKSRQHTEKRRPRRRNPLQDSEDETVLDVRSDTEDSTVPLLQQQQTPQIPPTYDESFMIDNSDYRVDARSDLYSVGAFLYHLVTGQKPSANPAQNTPLEQYVNFSDGFAVVVDRAMMENPQDRFQSAAEMLSALRGYARLDKRYKNMVLRQRIMFALLILGILASAFIATAGWNRMQKEQGDKYDSLLAQLSEARQNNDRETFDEIYGQVVEMKPESLDADVQLATFLYETGSYSEAITVIEKGLAQGSVDFTETDNVANMYFLLGNCYLEMGEPKNAVAELRNALYYSDEQPEYYRDYAIALARSNQVSDAVSVLDQAREKGLVEEQIALVRGEIALAQGDYQQALTDFRYCIDETNNDYVKMRAYLLSADVYDSMVGGVEYEMQKKALLEEALNRLPQERTVTVIEKLAECCRYLYDETSDESYGEQEAELYRRVLQNGWGTFATYNNLSVNYQKRGLYNEAMDVAREMESNYDSRYETYKRIAHLISDIQTTYPEAQRDYTEFVQYYEKAQELYASQVRGGETDPEMDRLREGYEELKQKGWIN